MDDVKHKMVIIAIALLPCFVSAAEPLILPKEEGTSQAKRFIPLAGAQKLETQNGVTIIREKAFIPLRTDKQALNNNGLVFDRARERSLAMPLPKPNTKPAIGNESRSATDEVKVTHELEPESDAIEGDNETINPVLALYGSDDNAALGSFSDVMRGGGVASLAGGARHVFWPVPLATKQYISSLYGIRNDPFHGRPTFHGGIDIAADKGSAVLATAAGEVTHVTEDSRYGKYIAIQHADGVVTRYGHLSSQSVSVGQRVRAGQLIGAVGSTGRSTGAHLDYRVSKNGVKYDPLSILTVPSSVAIKASSRTQVATAPAVNVFRANKMASNPLPKRPMVIQVR